MAIPAVNMQLVGLGGSSASGQVLSQGGVSGFQSKSVFLLGQATLDGAASTFTANYIDGTQKMFQRTITIPALNVTAPATIGGVANQSVISGVGAFGALSVGQSVVVTGFANSANNATFTVNVVTSSSIQVTNASAVAESNVPSGIVSANLGAKVLSARVSRATQGPTGVADTAVNTITASVNTITDASALITISATGSNTNLLSVLLELIASA